MTSRLASLRKRRLLGLEVAPCGMRAVLLEGRGGAPKVTWTAEFTREGELLPGEVQSALEEMTEGRGLRGVPVAAFLPAASCHISLHEMPPLTPERFARAAALQFELQDEDVGGSVNRAFPQTPRTGPGDSTAVVDAVLVSLDPGELDPTRTACASLKMPLRWIVPHAFCQSLDLPDSSRGPRIVLDLGYLGSQLSVVVGGDLRLVRNIRPGLQPTLAKLARSLKSTPGEALRFLREGQRSEELPAPVQKFSANLAQEIQRTNAYVASRMGLNITAVQFIGPWAAAKMLTEPTAQELDLPVEVLAGSPVAVQAPATWNATLQRACAAAAVAWGTPEKALVLREKRIAPAPSKRSSPRWVLPSLVTVVILAAAMGELWTRRSLDQASDAARTSAAALKLQEGQFEVPQDQQELRLLAERLESLQQVYRQRSSPVPVATHLASDLPERILLSSLEWTGPKKAQTNKKQEDLGRALRPGGSAAESKQPGVASAVLRLQGYAPTLADIGTLLTVLEQTRLLSTLDAIEIEEKKLILSDGPRAAFAFRVAGRPGDPRSVTAESQTRERGR